MQIYSSFNSFQFEVQMKVIVLFRLIRLIIVLIKMKLERKRWHFGSKGGQVEATGLLNLRPPISDACMGYVITQMGFLKLPRLAGVEERFPAEFTELYGRPLNSYFFSLEGLKIIFKLSMGMCSMFILAVGPRSFKMLYHAFLFSPIFFVFPQELTFK